MRHFLSTHLSLFKHLSGFTRKPARLPSIDRSTYQMSKTTHHEGGLPRLLEYRAQIRGCQA